MDNPPCGRSYLVVVPPYYESYGLIFLREHYGWDFMAVIDINPSSMGPIFLLCIWPSLGIPKWNNLPLGHSYLVVVPSYQMPCCLIWGDSLNWTLWVRFDGWYWYKSFIDGFNIWYLNRTYHWGLEMDHLPLGHSYLVEVLSYEASRGLILFGEHHSWKLMADIDINPSSMHPIFGVWTGKDWALESRNGPSSIKPLPFGSSGDVWCVMWLDSLTETLWMTFEGWYWYQSFIDESNI